MGRLGLGQWREDIQHEIENLQEDSNYDTRYAYSNRVRTKVNRYMAKERLSLLELVIWKAEIDKWKSKDTRLKRKFAKMEIYPADKANCRMLCGADIIIANVLPFLIAI